MTIENVVEVCVAMDIAIVGIAYPIIVDKISTIGDKYSSSYLSDVFNAEAPHSIERTIFGRTIRLPLFKTWLILTIVSLLFLVFKAKPFFGWNNWFINNSAALAVVFASAVLTFLFLRWLGKVSLYNGRATSLITHIIQRYQTRYRDTDKGTYHLKAVNELSFYAIEKQDDHFQETLLEFYSKEFRNVRSGYDGTAPLVYPIDLYQFVAKLNYQLASVDNKKLLALEHRAVSGVWLFGEGFDEIPISEETYSWIWHNLYTICDRPRHIKAYWGTAHQYFDFRLKNIRQQYDGAVRAVVNTQAIERRAGERKRFLELHYALGGLLLYREQYKTIDYVFNYSQSQPAQHPLLPPSMTDIFEWFEAFRNEFHSVAVEHRYSFPELDNLGNRRQVRHWICCYLALLFIRQYTLPTYYVYQRHTDRPALPDDVLELLNWQGGIPYFVKCLNDVLANQTLLKDTGLLAAATNNGQKFDQFIVELKAHIQAKIDAKRISAELSDVKIRQFKETTNGLVSNSFDQYQSVFSTINAGEDARTFEIRGLQQLASKASFTEGEIPTLNFDSFFAELVSDRRIQSAIPNSFFAVRTDRYLIGLDDVVYALRKLASDATDVVVVAINATHELREALTHFDGDVRHIQSSEYQVDDALFILRKENLPSILFSQLSNEEIEESALEKINSDKNIYASVIDINRPENHHFRARWQPEELQNALELKVQVTIDFRVLIRWKSRVEVVQLNVTSPYREQGVQNSVDDIKTLQQADANSDAQSK